MMLTAVLTLAAAVPLAAHVGSAALALGRRVRSQDAASFRPFISLIRPAKGLDPFDRQTLASALQQDYPDYEVIYCVADPDDPACAAIREMIAAHPQVPARLLTGEAGISANPKLNNLEKGVASARSDWLVMADANLMLEPDYLAALADAWTPGTGLVSGPPLGTDAQNFWGAVECAFLNTNQARWQLAADALGIGFAQGKTLMWNRRVLEEVGGLVALGRDMAEDVASTKLVRSQGLKVRLPARLSVQPVGNRHAGAVWDRQLRWSRIRRAGFPGLFASEIAQGPVLGLSALGILATLGAAPGSLAALYFVLWYGAEAAFARGIGLALAPRDLAAMTMRDLLLPALWIVTFARRGFDWRGTAVMAETAE